MSKFLNKAFSAAVFYPTHWWNLFMSKVFSFRNWWDAVDDVLILGARPNNVDAEQLSEIGVTGVVNTCDEYAGPVSVYEKNGIEQLHIPTIDFTHPLIDDVEAAVDFITKHATRGGRVYVHCKAGRARSATVAICWLMELSENVRKSGPTTLAQSSSPSQQTPTFSACCRRVSKTPKMWWMNRRSRRRTFQMVAS